MGGTWRFAARFLARDWRAGELRLLALALVIAVAAISAVGFFTQRVRLGLESQSGEVLGGDLVVLSGHPVGTELARAAHRAGLRTVRTLSFPSMAGHGNRHTLATIRAVGSAWPLKGAVGIAARPFGPVTRVRHGPRPGHAWLDPRLMSLLHLRPGDRVTVGDATLTVSRALAYEPDRSASFLSLAPHLMINLADVAKTGLVRPASRVRYRLLVAGPPAAVRSFRKAVEPHLDPATRLQDASDVRPQLAMALRRGQQFLALAALVSVILSGAAVAASSRQYMRRRLDSAAVLRCLGMPARQVAGVYAAELGAVGLLASLAGCAAGYLGQYGLSWLLGSLLGGRLPAAGWSPALPGLATGLLLLLGFAMPPLLHVSRVPPARVLRRELGTPGPPGLLTYAAAVLAVGALLWWHTAETALTLRVFGGIAGTAAALGAAGLALIGLLGRLRRGVGTSWRFGIAAIARRRGESVIQLVAFGLGIMLLLLLSLVRADLLAGWRSSVPADAPNEFLINIQKGQRQPLRSFMESRGVTRPRLYPMVRARLVAHNGTKIRPGTYRDPRARHLAEREFNLSWAARLQPGNRVVAGHWWTRADHGKPLLSVERGLAQRLGLKVGDTLRFYVAGRSLTLRIASLRKVAWDSFRVNFFTVTPPGVLAGFPATWITSFYLPPGHGQVLSDLMKRFPDVSVIDVNAILDQVRTVMQRVSMAVQYVFGFTLAAGVLVLLTSVQTTRRERLYESAILRTLGASRRTVLAGVAAEFVVLGALAGLIGGLAALAAGQLLASQLFHFAYRPDPLVPLVGIVAGAGGIGLTGVLATRSVLRQPPVTTLREHGQSP
ncbi:MAG TPA: FtsX-like permease family protein [Gammaproteobacteria bacterium]|nr:FtsX-like permease family protein [Gammaproteobacteria bacterium]